MSLLQITYTSRATERFARSDLPELVETSQRRNETAQITGALCFSEGRFVQVLEGPADAVAALYAEITNDPRHTAVTTVASRPITDRQFSGWGMGHLSIECVDHAAREAFRIAHSPGAVWSDGALNDILEGFQRSLSSSQRA